EPVEVEWQGVSVRLTANSRRPGDADPWTQLVCIDVTRQFVKLNAFQFGLSREREELLPAFALALLWKESWNNPFAAAPQSSALSCFQFLDRTRSTLASRCTSAVRKRIAGNPCDVYANQALFLEHLKELLRAAESRVNDGASATEFYRVAYGLHHDWTAYDDSHGSPTRALAEEVVERMQLIEMTMRGVPLWEVI
ncbi:MAG: hypothetical protein KDD44_09365, partial [Bdellovibrionales bacterium]|nr:hypothetical protein [Bdellovibrionales bacterium]